MYNKNQYRPQGKLSREERLKRAETRRRNKILKEFSRTADLYDYDTIAFDARSAAHYGFKVYWDICSKGHIGEFTLKKSCKTCAKVARTIRDARERGTAEVKLAADEKNKLPKSISTQSDLAVKPGSSITLIISSH